LTWRTKQTALVVSYIAAACGANLVVAALGRPGLFVTAFILIPFDLVARDGLHEAWHGKGLVWKMACLVAAGSACSTLMNSGSWQVSVASFVSFALAGTVDTVVYWRLYRAARTVKMTISNLASSLTDSLSFVVIVFGLDAWTILSQWAIKFLGAALWVWILYGRKSWTRATSS
jgi:uncharacterized PurR-regulated membrane protein YhhQ (DUF165 family)